MENHRAVAGNHPVDRLNMIDEIVIFQWHPMVPPAAPGLLEVGRTWPAGAALGRLGIT